MKKLDDDLWVVDWRPVLPGGVDFPARMTVVRLPDGSLWLHSACTIDDTLAAQLAELGPVRHIVVPSLFHDLGGAGAKARYPDATLWSAPGWSTPAGVDAVELADGAPEAWGGVIEGMRIAGAPRVNEVVFHHRPSKTLVVCDLVFNLDERFGCLLGAFFSMLGVNGRFALSRSWKVWFVRDKPAASAAVQRVLAWDFERLIVGHGEVLEQRAKERLREALSWFG